MTGTLVVVPCFDEAERLLPDEFLRLIREGRTGIVFVDDGSKDATRSVLEGIRDRAEGAVRIIGLERNVGKGEAVRQGLNEAIGSDADWVGFLDADLSTPVDDFVRLLERARVGRLDVIMGARVALHGADISRRPERHYPGRIFATFASVILRMAIYDTQCGAKVFRSTPALVEALEEPFRSRWAFDVEILGRLLTGPRGQPGIDPRLVREIPLETWHDRPGSKVRAIDMVRVAGELVLIARDLEKRRASR